MGGGTFIELFPAAPDAPDGQGRIIHFSVVVESMASALQALATAGVEALRGPFTVNGDTPAFPTRIVAFIAGPDGEEIELVENVIEP
ncbi:MAG: hypothetical protein GF331_13925 [Chitinivibrionales bacterium]|nr:hypothetical protein [Chitinivibrionales bacterium]